MSEVVNIDVEYLPEGVYLATSKDVQGLVAQAETLDQLIKIVPDLVDMLDEISVEQGWAGPWSKPVTFNFKYAMLLAA